MSKPRMSEPERVAWFWREVVFQNLRDLLSPNAEGASEEDRRLAAEWVLDDNPHHGSFLWACSAAMLDPEAVRDVLREKGIV